MNVSDRIKEIELIIFDFDGTLHRGDVLSLPIFQKCLKMIFENHKINRNIPNDEEILSQFGEQVDYIYPTLLGIKNPSVINELAKCVETLEIQALNEGKAELFHGTESILDDLKKRHYKLALCTNARKDYFDAIVQAFDLKRYFEVMYAAGLFKEKINKTWMVGEILKKLNVKKFVFVGDRIHDIEAAKAHNGISIGCAYGFGRTEVKNADIVISDISELLNIFSSKS